jgi:polar amino acid transport system permease protein
VIRGELGFLLRGIVGVNVLLGLVLLTVYGHDLPSLLGVLAARSPQLLFGSARLAEFGGGFSANILISLAAMALAMVAGTLLGNGLISPSLAIKGPCAAAMNVLRNSPWLVILYAMLYLLPFEFRLFGHSFNFSPFLKAVVGLSLPIAANFAEIFRGGVNSIPSGQWESARALGYRRVQILRHIVIPQSIPLMIPNIMSLYAALFIGTSLVVVTGTSDVLSVTRTIIATEGERIATGLYIYVLALFFIFCFPIAVASRWLELRLQSRA